MERTLTKQELLDTIRSERADLDRLVTSLGPDLLTQSGVVGEWSIKDLIAHITAWESRPIAWFKAARDGTRPSPAPWDPGMDEDQINAWIWRSSQTRSLDTVLSESSRGYSELVDLLGSMPEQDLTTPRRFVWQTSGSLVDAVAGNTYEHYREHAAQIRAWLLKIDKTRTGAHASE